MKAFIYDMDGVIIDSEPMHLRVEQQILAKQGITDTTIEHLEKYQGSSDINMWQDLVEKHHLNYPAEKFVAAKKYLFNRTMEEEGATPIPGALDLIERTHQLRKQGVKTAIASSSERKFINCVVQSLGIDGKFDTIESGDELPQSKPDPAIYLQAAAHLMVDPKECVVLEDTENGARAAKAAGMYCIGFISPHSGQQDLSMCDEVVDDMKDIDLERFFR